MELTSKLSREQLQELYVQALERTKDLHADVWNGMRFFTGIQVVLLSVVGGLSQIKGTNEVRVAPLILLLVVALVTNGLGLFTLHGHRKYYLDSLRVKTVLERLLNLHVAAEYDGRIHSLVLPWTVPIEDQEKLLQDPDGWREQYIFRRGITFALFVTYLVFALLDAAAIVLVSTGHI